MENENKNATPLITPEDVPAGRPNLTVVPDPVEMIELPEHLKPQTEPETATEPAQMIEMPEHLKPQASAEVAHDLGSAALGADEGNRNIPIENPGPQAIRQSLPQIAPNTYMIPAMKEDSER